MEQVRTPVYRVTYEGKDITIPLSPYVVSVTYTDHEHGKSDEIQIRIEDRDARWKAGWYPAKGDTIVLAIGYEGEPMLPCGSFEVDEIEASGPPDTIDLKGLATPITKALRQRNTTAYEQKTLREIAAGIASKHGLEVVGQVADIRVKRITQKQERDLAFLKRLAEEYGYVFKVADGKLVFYEAAALESTAVVATIARTEMSSYVLRDTTREAYRACTVSYHDPKGKRLLSYTAEAGAEDVAKGDSLKISARCESTAQAMTKAKAALAKANGTRTEGSVTVEGSPKLAAGSNIRVSGLGKLDGTYHITTSTHTIDRAGGYRTDLEVKRV
jgi:phage protein D